MSYDDDSNPIREMAMGFEAKKHAFRQTQDGIVVSFVIHPQEMPDGLALAPLGTRYQVAVVELADNEEPKPAPFKKQNTLSQRVAAVCREPLFERFAEWTMNGIAPPPADFVRSYCGVKSRSEIVPGSVAASRWDKLMQDYASWKLGAE